MVTVCWAEQHLGGARPQGVFAALQDAAQHDMGHLFDEQGRDAHLFLAEQGHVARLDRARPAQALDELEHHPVVVAGVGVGQFLEARRRHGHAGVGEKRGVKGALGIAGLLDGAHFRAHQVGAQKIIADLEVAIAVALQQVISGNFPEVRHVPAMISLGAAQDVCKVRERLSRLSRFDGAQHEGLIPSGPRGVSMLRDASFAGSSA